MPTNTSNAPRPGTARAVRHVMLLALVVASACAGDDDEAIITEPARSVPTTVAPRPPGATEPPATTTVATPAEPVETTTVTTRVEAVETTAPSTSVQRVERADPSIFDYKADADVPFEVISTSSYRGIEMQRIKFASPLGGPAYGYLAEPVGETVPGVGILRAHGAPVDGTDEFIPMAMLACAGVRSIVVDAPWARPGVGRPGNELLFAPGDRDEQIQLIVDMRRALDLLADLGADRFGFGGISYGASIGGQLIGVDDRVEAAVLILGTGGLVERFFDEDGEPVWPVSDLEPDRIEAWREAMLPIEPMWYIGDTSADVLFMNGLDDPLIPPVEAERYHAAGPVDAEVYWMDIDHDIPFEDMKIVHNHWFAERLGFDPDRIDSCTDELFANGWDDL